MIIRIDKSFARDVKKLNDADTGKKIVTLISKLEEALNLSDIKNLK
ncbi:MAG: hypothetical protein HND52_06905 [Ignavibacteriae bacterium]|nr:hypothetical protein [Ignavibacteriota bacterium]